MSSPLYHAAVRTVRTVTTGTCHIIAVPLTFMTLPGTCSQCLSVTCYPIFLLVWWM